MKSDWLPTELQDLETRIHRAGAEKPSNDLRSRVLRAVDAELAKATSPVTGGGDSWYWMALAASVLMVLNVSLIFASRSEFSLGPAVDENSLGDELRALRTVENQLIEKPK